MGWHRKARGAPGGYFYRSVRLPGRRHPVKVYLGRGPEAHEVAGRIECDRRAREDGRRAASAEAARLAGPDAVIAELGAAVAVLAAAWLAAAGMRRHRGQWRRRRWPRSATAGTSKEGDMARRKPVVSKGDGRPWSWMGPPGRRDLLRDLTRKAEAGDEAARADVARLLGTFPEEFLDPVGDLAKRAEGAWTEAVGLGDPAAAAAARREADRLRAELGGHGAVGLERLLIDHVVVNHLAERHSQLLLADLTPDHGLTAVRLRRAEATQRRLLAAVKALALVRAVAAATPDPAGRARVAGGGEVPARSGAGERAPATKRPPPTRPRRPARAAPKSRAG